MRLAQVLTLLRDVRPHLRQRDVGHRVGHAVVEPGHADRHIARRRDADARFPADETFGSEIFVGQREHGTDAELPVQLVERRRAKAGADVAPRADLVGDLIARRGARADHGVGSVGEARRRRSAGCVAGRLVVGRRPRDDRRLQVVGVVVPPVIDARAERHRQLRQRRQDVLHERAQALLRPAGHALEREDRVLRRRHDDAWRRVVRRLLAVAVHMTPIGARAEVVRGPKHLGPLHHAADAGRRHVLIHGQADDAARGDGGGRRGDREERAVEVLEVGEEARLQIAVVRHPDPHAAARRLPPRVVDLAHLAVDAVFAEVAGAGEQLHAVRRAVVDLAVEVAELHRRVDIDEPLLARHHDRKSVGVEHAAVHGDAQLAPHIARRVVELRAAVISVLRLDLERPPRWTGADDVDDAAHRVVAVEAGARSVDDLDAIHAFERHARPVDPAAEGIVERCAVHQDERAADAARPDAAQRHALRRRMRRQAARAAEQAERRDLPQHVVGDDGGRLANLFAAQDVDAGRDIAEPLLASTGRDGNGLEQAGGRQRDVERPRRIGDVLNPLGEAARAHRDRDVAAARRVDSEAAVRTCRHAQFRA